MQLDLKVGFGLQLTGKKHSFGIFASLARGGLEMNRGRKVQSRDRPAEERQRGSGGDGVTDCWVSGSASLQKHCSPPPAPRHLHPAHGLGAWSSVRAPRNGSPAPTCGPVAGADLERKCEPGVSSRALRVEGAGQGTAASLEGLRAEAAAPPAPAPTAHGQGPHLPAAFRVRLALPAGRFSA